MCHSERHRVYLAQSTGENVLLHGSFSSPEMNQRALPAREVIEQASKKPVGPLGNHVRNVANAALAEMSE